MNKKLPHLSAACDNAITQLRLALKFANGNPRDPANPAAPSNP